MSGFIQTVLYADFFYYYVKWCVPYRRNPHPCAGVMPAWPTPASSAMQTQDEQAPGG